LPVLKVQLDQQVQRVPTVQSAQQALKAPPVPLGHRVFLDR
jgi:hypothetical protein